MFPSLFGTEMGSSRDRAALHMKIGIPSFISSFYVFVYIFETGFKRENSSFNTLQTEPISHDHMELQNHFFFQNQPNLLFYISFMFKQTGYAFQHNSNYCFPTVMHAISLVASEQNIKKNLYSGCLRCTSTPFENDIISVSNLPSHP